MRFDLTTGRSVDPKLALKIYPVRVDDQGRVLVELDA
jgi:nitrite reductase/ring-hydroxylating ferredoxin subunit